MAPVYKVVGATVTSRGKVARGHLTEEESVQCIPDPGVIGRLLAPLWELEKYIEDPSRAMGSSKVVHTVEVVLQCTGSRSR